MQLLNNLLRDENWSSLDGLTEANEMQSSFHDTFIRHQNGACPYTYRDVIEDFLDVFHVLNIIDILFV